MCVRDGISRLAMLLSLLTGLTSLRRTQRLRNNNFQFIRKQKKSSTIKCCWKLFIQPYLGTILCLRLLFRNQLFPTKASPSFSKVSFPLLNYPYLYLRKHSSVVLCATLHSVYEQSSLTNTFTARNFSFFSSPFFLLSLCSEFQIKTELNWSPFAILESYLSRSWLWQSFSAFLPSSQHSVWTQNNRETKIHVREQRKPSIEWNERRKMFPISQREEKFFQFSLFFSSLGCVDAVALITENGT